MSKSQNLTSDIEHCHETVKEMKKRVSYLEAEESKFRKEIDSLNNDKDKLKKEIDRVSF